MIISVNLVKTYPVSWSKYKVMRDFIQNFYDSVGYSKWNDAFHFAYRKKEKKLEMYIEKVTFSYEWLLHIGASTKTKNSQDNAGYFGEGFKIAALCGLRDFDFTICMESGDWRLRALFLKSTIDNQDVEMLAYDILTRKKDDKTKLTIGNFSERDYETFQVSLLSFFYPENPMFGKKIWESKNCAVFYRSKDEINNRLPCVAEFGRKGAVFCGYQMLGTNPFSLVICMHQYKKDDRERNSLYSFDVIHVFENIVYWLDAKAAMCILEKMRRFWNARDKCKYDIHSWKTTIYRLVDKISTSTKISEEFRKKYPNIVCLKPIHSIEDINQRHQAREWYKSSGKEYIFANQAFLSLGYTTLEEQCRIHGGFAEKCETNEREQKCFSVLKTTVDKIYANFFVLHEKPSFKIIKNPEAIYHGMASCIKQKTMEKNAFGMRIRSTIQSIYIKRSALSKNNFYDALTTYIHELCHMFGGDSSHSFSLALTEAMTLLLEHRPDIEEGRREWERIFESESLKNQKKQTNQGNDQE